MNWKDLTDWRSPENETSHRKYARNPAWRDQYLPKVRITSRQTDNIGYLSSIRQSEDGVVWSVFNVIGTRGWGGPYKPEECEVIADPYADPAPEQLRLF